VATKVSKRIETNKLRGAFKETPKTLLLPVSLGVSSVSLIWVLNQQLASQHERNGKALFKLHVLSLLILIQVEMHNVTKLSIY